MPTVDVAQQRAVPVALDDAFRGTLTLQLPTLFRRWYGPIPPIKEVRDQTGEWGTLGQTRTIALTGGGTMRERLTEVDPPNAFGYELTEITGAVAPLVERIEGRWTCTPTGTGTEIGWQWRMHPRSALTRPLVALVGKLWLGYARNALAELSDQLVASA